MRRARECRDRLNSSTVVLIVGYLLMAVFLWIGLDLFFLKAPLEMGLKRELFWAVWLLAILLPRLVHLIKRVRMS